MERNYIQTGGYETDRSALLFLNTNKARININKMTESYRLACQFAGLSLSTETITSKGPDRSIDRDAVNELIACLLTGRYEVVVVKKIEEITEDKADLMEFLIDAAKIGVVFFELCTMQFYSCGCLEITGQRKIGRGDIIVWE